MSSVLSYFQMVSLSIVSIMYTIYQKKPITHMTNIFSLCSLLFGLLPWEFCISSHTFHTRDNRSSSCNVFVPAADLHFSLCLESLPQADDRQSFTAHMNGVCSILFTKSILVPLLASAVNSELYLGVSTWAMGPLFGAV